MSDTRPRRVIPIKVEPPSSLTAAQRSAVLDISSRLKDVPGALMPLFHAVQDALGYVPKDSVPLIAQALNLSIAEVHGVLTFYHYFRKTPPGKHVVHLCRAEACQAVGAVELEAHAKRSLGIDFHGTTPDGAVSLEPVYCLGNCALGPSVMVDDQLKGRVNPRRFDELVAVARKTSATAA
jgi:formate dehydrogenase subunit gamma